MVRQQTPQSSRLVKHVGWLAMTIQLVRDEPHYEKIPYSSPQFNQTSFINMYHDRTYSLPIYKEYE
ncbi:hypothetical protein SK128_025443 [Halocaridina rubra]|uniref:Uncharacterized protein n=1 Tax=Halocaridina rubra TaxID=373956 RepID=A0AAN8XES7_HALRR